MDSWFIIDWVEKSCMHHGDAIAILEDDTGVSISYCKLHERMLTLTKQLQKIIIFPDRNNLAPGSAATPLVSLLTDRSIGSIVGMLSILKAGAAYVPVDPSFPADRQAYIFSHSKSQLLIVDQANFANLQSMKVEDGGELPPVVVIDAEGNFIQTTYQESTNNILRHTTTGSNKLLSHSPADECLAYVLYTSGSTGKPKGVMVHNQGLVNVVRYFCDIIELQSTDRVLGLTTFCFDISMLEIYMPLTTGAGLVIVSAKTQKNPSNIIDVLYNYHITVMQATPTSYEMILACGWEGDKNITCLVGGEACRPQILSLAHTCKSLYNVYGPTETSIWSSAYRFPANFPYQDKPANQLNIPIGAPISLTSFYIVNEDMQLVKEGEEGELIIGGDGIAVGYLHAPDLTEKRFLSNPFGTGRIYRTGDLVVKLLDGSNNYTFVRRADDQVKVNGYRIELGEVELAIAKHPKIAQVVVIVTNNALFGFLKVKAEYLSEIDCDERTFFTELKAFTGKSLMPYMIPKHFMLLDLFPTTANGKLDKLSLSKLANEYKPAAEHHHLHNTEEEQSGVSVAHIALINDPLLAHSMVQFVLEQIETATGSVPSPEQTFAAIGIDSLAALLFRNVLSKSLGGLKIDQNILYNANTTINTFAEYLYDRLLSENPILLRTLDIRCGNPLASCLSDDLESGMKVNKSKSNESLGQALLYHRNLIDGYRGFIAILVLFDHFFDNPDIYGIREHSDTLLFIVMTGFTIEIQNLTNPMSYLGEWNWRSFLWTRAIGLFPIYWLTLLLCIPRFMIYYHTYALSTTRTIISVICYVLAIQTWSREINTDLFYGVYYVSLIWGTFLVYAYLRTVYQTTQLSFVMKIVCYLMFVGFAIGMHRYSSIGYFHPFFGCIYFTVGMIVARLYAYFRPYFPLYLSSLPSTLLTTTTTSSTTSSSCWNTLYKPCQSMYIQYFPPFTPSDTSYLTQQPSIPFINKVFFYCKRYSLSIGIDFLCFLMLFIMFYHDFPNKSSPVYCNYDRFFYLYGNIILFSLLFIFSLYQSTLLPKSVFTLLLSETYLLRMIGEASYSLYLLQKIVVFFWFDSGIDGIRYGKYPYTRSFLLLDHHDSVIQYPWVTFVGVLVVIVISIGVQKIFQEKWIANMQIWCMSTSSSATASAAVAGGRKKQQTKASLQGRSLEEEDDHIPLMRISSSSQPPAEAAGRRSQTDIQLELNDHITIIPSANLEENENENESVPLLFH